MLRVLALLLCSSSPCSHRSSPRRRCWDRSPARAPWSSPPACASTAPTSGWTFEHRGQHFMLFGDTWPHPRSPCEALPHNDDSQATMPLELLRASRRSPSPPIPRRRTSSRASACSATANRSSWGTTRPRSPRSATARDAVCLFGLIDLVRCRSRRGRPSCRPYDHLTCSQEVGICTPPTLGLDAPCDVATGAGCIAGQRCEATATGICIDPRQLAERRHLREPARDRRLSYPPRHPGRRAAIRLPRCRHAGVQQVHRRHGTDGALLLRTRVRQRLHARARRRADLGTSRIYDVQPGRQAHMYLMVHRLPIHRNAAGALQLRPRFFAGVRPGSGEPLWTRHGVARQAARHGRRRRREPGRRSAVPEPDGRQLARAAREQVDDAVRRRRFGPERRFRPGCCGRSDPRALRRSSLGAVEPLGRAPGSGKSDCRQRPVRAGWLHLQPCLLDQPPAVCAPSDPTRPLDYFLPGCPGGGRALDTGILYAPNIIDAYTRSDGAGGLDVFWNVSVWNPYLVALLRTNVKPGAASPATACSSDANARAVRGRLASAGARLAVTGERDRQLGAPRTRLMSRRLGLAPAEAGRVRCATAPRSFACCPVYSPAQVTPSGSARRGDAGGQRGRRVRHRRQGREPRRGGAGPEDRRWAREEDRARATPGGRQHRGGPDSRRACAAAGKATLRPGAGSVAFARCLGGASERHPRGRERGSSATSLAPVP